MTITELVQQSYGMAVKKGFHDGPVNIDQKLLLVVSELAEAQDELRKGLRPDEVYTVAKGLNDAMCVTTSPLDLTPGEKPEGFGVELADAVIRIADLAGVLGLDLQSLITTKMVYNAGRPAKHGKRF